MDLIKTWLLYPLPHHWISRLVYYLTRRRSRLRVPAMRAFIRHFRVDMDEAEHTDPGAYPTFNAFFTRRLRDGARTVDPDPDAIVSPVDGRVSQAGDCDRRRLLQAKGMEYSIAELLGGRQDLADTFDGGRFATLYLSPRDYHRIHMPLRGRLIETTYVPGRLYSVAPHTVDNLPNLFTRNERVSALFETGAGPMAMVLVGAINVAAIETVWSGLVTPPRGRGVHRWAQPDDEPLWLEKGEEMGRFNMGSTVILLLPPGPQWQSELRAGAEVRLGRAIGRLEPAAEALSRAGAS